MEQVILIEYGELTTKKGNRNFFVQTLKQNIQAKLKNISCEIISDPSRMMISSDNLSEVQKKLGEVFGIHAYHIAYKTESTEETINETVLEIMKNKNFQTFKVEAKRSNKQFPIRSMEYAAKLGGIILKNIPNVKVDVHSPDILCKVEIRRDFTYIYSEKIAGLGGYPVGTQTKGMLMLSGGIDSPVAGYLAMKRGMKIDAVYFEAIPHTSIEARNKVITLTKKLSKYTNKICLHIVPFTKIQESIYKKCEPDYCITIMRRMMYRIMVLLAQKNHAHAIVNGESLGQVASQTIESMYVINEVTNMPVIRPVVCLDKLEIIDIAKKIDTYETSILPYEDCCTVFVPKHPVIHPELELAKEMEQRFDFETMLQEAVENTKHMTIKENEENPFQDLL